MSRKACALTLISGVGAKGPACFLLEAEGRRLLLDLGEGPPHGLLPDLDGIGHIDAVVLSHGHKDHVGGLSLLPKLGNPPVYATAIVARALGKDIATRELPLRGRGEILGIAVETGRDGHAPGGIWLNFGIGAGFLYTGDYSTESMLYAYDPPQRPAATALIDGSYARYGKPLAQCWAALAPLLARGPALLPVPANGRGPELALEILRAGSGDIYVDDTMARAFQHLANGSAESLRSDARDDIKRLAASAKPIAAPRGVMLAASADGSSGSSAALLEQWEQAVEPEIVFTGYVPPGTPAARLIKSGRARFVRWNVHPRLSDTLALVRAVQPKTVVPAFCDRSELDGLATALAPARVTMDGPVAI